MNTSYGKLDWSLLQSFAAVGEHGSLSAAARAMGSSQPTLSRHIATLEQQLGARLCKRVSGGAELTPFGLALLSHVQDMADAAARLSIASGNKIESLSGTVRITASQIMATLILPETLAQLRRAEPEIDIEIIASDKTDNLLRREADIAIRMYRPTQADVIAKKVGEARIGAFATSAYLEHRGVPETVEEFLDHDVIGYDRSTLIIDGFKQFGVEVDRNFFAFRSDDQVVCWKMVVAGFGIGFNQLSIGDAEPKVQRIGLAGDVGILPIWIASHNELRTNARVRRVFDFLADALSRIHAPK